MKTLKNGRKRRGWSRWEDEMGIYFSSYFTRDLNIKFNIVFKYWWALREQELELLVSAINNIH